ncbi:MAG: four helix bundle protein [Chitinophagales bacterium]
MDTEPLKRRTKVFAIRVMQMCEQLQANYSGRVIANQLIRSSTSTGANYRAVCRSRSQNDFIAKMALVSEEADENVYWLELLQESGLFKVDELEQIMVEAKELSAIFTASLSTARKNKKSESKK